MPQPGRALACVFALVAVDACKLPGGPAAASAPSAPPTGIAVFTRHAQFERVRISPKGTYLAASTFVGGKRSLVFIDLRTRKSVNVLSPGAEDMVGTFHWASDERVIIELVTPEGDLATPKFFGELYGVNASGGNPQRVFGYRAGARDGGPRIIKVDMDRAWGRYVDTMKGDGRHVLIEATFWEDTGDRTATLFKLDAYNGTKVQLAKSPLPNADFVTDERGMPRLALGFDGSLTLRSYYRDATDGGWRRLETLAGLGTATEPLAFSAVKRRLYVSDGDAAGNVLAAVDVDTGARQVLARNPFVPPTTVLTDPATNEVVAAQFDPDLPVYEYTVPDHPLSKLLVDLLQSFEGEHVRIVSTTDDASKVVALVYSDRNPGQYYLVDAATRSAEELIAHRPWIRPDEMAELTAFHTRASDGVTIHGYFAVPRSAAEPKALPLVVLPHGGPHTRDYWTFDPDVQLFASRGFAVLKVNYRGSAGYGRAYQEAGYRHWGDRVQQDIIDATRMLVSKGYVDPARVCIFGASFGGYSAMQSAILAPDLFRCAVGYAGVYDLTLLGDIDDIAKSALASTQIKTTLGANEAVLRAMSPAAHADKLKARVMLVHGAKDKRAPLEHAELLRDALARRGRHVEWVVERLEGHGFYDEGARERMYRKVLDFIEENTRPVVDGP